MYQRMPKHVEIADRIRSDISQRAYHPTRSLPALATLAATYGVSRVTMREAMLLLQSEGLVHLKQGHGTVLTQKALRLNREPVDAEENFRNWKELVRLPQEFPSLRPLEPEELNLGKRLHLRSSQKAIVKQIMTSTAARSSVRPYVAVLVNRGHGCTTLFRYVFRLLTSPDDPDSALPAWGAQVIPVQVTWSRLGADPTDFTSRLSLMIRIDVARQLVDPKWATLLDPVAYATVIGAIRDDVDEPDPMSHRRELAQFVGALDSDRVSDAELRKRGGRTPQLMETALPRLLVDLDRFGIKTLLMIDMSAGDWPGDPDVVAYDELLGAIKDIHDPLPSGQPPFSELYFLSNSTLDRLQGLFERSPDRIVFPYYTQADFFGILARHYPPLLEFAARDQTDIHYSTTPVASLVPSEFLSYVERSLSEEGLSFADVGLFQISELMRRKIIESMDVPWPAIHYHLLVPDAR